MFYAQNKIQTLVGSGGCSDHRARRGGLVQSRGTHSRRGCSVGGGRGGTVEFFLEDGEGAEHGVGDGGGRIGGVVGHVEEEVTHQGASQAVMGEGWDG